MKTHFKDPANIRSRFERLFGSMLVIALILPTIATSQSSPSRVNLGTAEDFVILSKTGISSTGTTQITGDIGVSPVAAAYLTGFGLIMDTSGTFSTSSLITGKAYAADYTSPTPTKMTMAVGDMETAYTDAAGRTNPNFTELYSGDVTGKILTPGLYKWGTGILISAAGVTISGTPSDIWIFQIAQNLTVENGAIVTLSGGAQASNIFWQVAGQVNFGTTAAMKGIILCQTAIAMGTGATLDGIALAQTAVTLNANAVSKPATATSVTNSFVPQTFALFQNFPNPFNPSTTIQFNLSKAADVSLKIYNILGYEFATLVKSNQEAGSYSVPFGNSKQTFDLSSGVYFYRLEAGSYVATKKFILIK